LYLDTSNTIKAGGAPGRVGLGIKLVPVGTP
jgi:hypothetical protein